MIDARVVFTDHLGVEHEFSARAAEVYALPPISPEVITGPPMRAEDMDGVHLWSTSDPLMRPLCGAEDDKHDCAIHHVPKTIVSCPECGQPVCTYCKLLA